MERIPTKHVVLGLTGGVAAYKGAELTRLLITHGLTVQVAMTEAACEFITPLTLQALSGRPVLTHQWDEEPGDHMAHISLSRTADAILIAPATADFIAKLAHGLADDLLSSLCLARNCPLLVAPAMNRHMWEHPATQRNLQQLVLDGVTILGPVTGSQACGEEGMGRMQDTVELANALLNFLQPKSLAGVKLLLTAGPTYEAIDPVRGITNRSSGKMGYAVAQAALELGASVTIVSGPTALAPPKGAKLINVTSAEEMFAAVKANLAGVNIFVGVAAVADYRATQPSVQKLKKSKDELTLTLAPNPDILGYVASLPTPPFCVGFAAESHDLKAHATEKRKTKNIPLIAANIAQDAIGSDSTELTLFDDAGEHVLPRSTKLTAARTLLQHAVQLYQRGRTP
ncbi:MAG: bifunctional phosphopantothenoylcysteine decarboxylase/phosphopantothenate--cysteine ligase CoaBC [Candidatus Nitrotoga sp.]|nr:bifunctional phosphopantothenoylcysteine decarboxylase/phosphopantothenate--cysteine ligase CoaBC [Candidatus Nitrotoga sp.]